MMRPSVCLLRPPSSFVVSELYCIIFLFGGHLPSYPSLLFSFCLEILPSACTQQAGCPCVICTSWRFLSDRSCSPQYRLSIFCSPWHIEVFFLYFSLSCFSGIRAELSRAKSAGCPCHVEKKYLMGVALKYCFSCQHRQLHENVVGLQKNIRYMYCMYKNCIPCFFSSRHTFSHVETRRRKHSSF